MKRILVLILTFSLMFSFAVFAEEEFSSNADIDYDYNESYDETETVEEITSNKYDDVKTSYDENYDEFENVSYGDEYADEPIPEYSVPNNIIGSKVVKSKEISVFVNDEKVIFDVEPMIINDRTMVPVRAIFEALGASVSWDGNTQTARGVLDGAIVEITIGSMEIMKNGKSKTIDSPAVIISGRTLVPVRAIAESFECSVDWFGDTQVVEIVGY